MAKMEVNDKKENHFSDTRDVDVIITQKILNEMTKKQNIKITVYY